MFRTGEDRRPANAAEGRLRGRLERERRARLYAQAHARARAAWRVYRLQRLATNANARQALKGIRGLLLAILNQAVIDHLGPNPDLRDDANRFFHGGEYQAILRILGLPVTLVPEGLALYPVSERPDRCSHLTHRGAYCQLRPLPGTRPAACRQHVVGTEEEEGKLMN